MPTKRFENVDPERQQRIIGAARNEFIRHGYEDASLNIIVNEAEISKGSLYYYFEDKLDLFLTVVDEETRMLLGEVGEMCGAGHGGDYWEDVTAMVKSSLSFSLSHPDVMRLARELIYLSRSPHAVDQVRAFYDRWKASFAGIVADGQKAGAVRTDIPFDLLVDILYAVGEILDVWLARNWDEKPEPELNTTAMLYVDLMKRVAMPSPPRGGVRP